MKLDYESKLKQLALEDERIVVMTAENRAPVRSLPQALGDRFIDVGITEQTMIGAAAGLALRGRIPVVHALATFLTMRPFEFIRTDIGIGNLPVKLVAWVPGFLSESNGPTHQAIEDVSLMRGIPPMAVFCPGDQEDLVAGLGTVIKSPSPCYIRYNPRLAVVAHQPFEWGKAEVLSHGRDVALLTYGTLLTEAFQAKAILEDQGVSVKLVNLRMLKPLDEAAVLDAVTSTRLTVTVEDHFLTGGLHSILAELCLKRRLAPDVMPLALDGRWFKPSSLAEVLEYEGFTGPQIAQKVMARLQRSTHA